MLIARRPDKMQSVFTKHENLVALAVVLREPQVCILNDPFEPPEDDIKLTYARNNEISRKHTMQS